MENDRAQIINQFKSATCQAEIKENQIAATIFLYTFSNSNYDGLLAI